MCVVAAERETARLPTDTDTPDLVAVAAVSDEERVDCPVHECASGVRVDKKSQDSAAIDRASAEEQELGKLLECDRSQSPVMFGNMLLRNWRDVPSFAQWCSYQDSLPDGERYCASPASSQRSPSVTSSSCHPARC